MEESYLATGISLSEKAFTLEGIRDNCRVDGRSNLEYRHVKMAVGVVPTEFGSAHVSNGESDVIAGIKAELVAPAVDAPRRGKVFLNVSFAAPAAVDRALSAEDSTSFGMRLGTLLSSLCLNELVYPRELLCVEEGVFVWHIYVNLLVISIGGSLLDVASMAIVSAFRTAKLPSIKVVVRTDGGFEGDDAEIIKNQKSATPDLENEGLFDVRYATLHQIIRFKIEPSKHTPIPGHEVVPLLVSLGIHGNNCVADLRQEEASAVSHTVIAAVDEANRLVGLTKLGDSPLGLAILSTVSLRIQSLAPPIYKTLLSHIGAAKPSRLQVLPNII